MLLLITPHSGTKNVLDLGAKTGARVLLASTSGRLFYNSTALRLAGKLRLSSV